MAPLKTSFACARKMTKAADHTVYFVCVSLTSNFPIFKTGHDNDNFPPFVSCFTSADYNYILIVFLRLRETTTPDWEIIIRLNDCIP